MILEPLIALALGWVLGRQGAGPIPRAEVQKRKGGGGGGGGALPQTPTQVPWPVTDVAPPGGTPAQKKQWAAIQQAQQNEARNRQAMQEEMQREAAELGPEHRVP